MKSSRSAILAGALAVASVLAIAGLANAQPSGQLSDMGYIGAARCTGLAEGSHVDAAALRAVLAREENRHPAYALDRADEMRSEAKGQATRATGYAKQSIADELAGPCQSYLKG